VFLNLNIARFIVLRGFVEFWGKKQKSRKTTRAVFQLQTLEKRPWRVQRLTSTTTDNRK